jgi:hypothetical protein
LGIGWWTKNKFTESAFEGLKREIQEEVGDTPKFKKVIPLEMFTSNDQKFFFHTYLVAIESEFIPKLNRNTPATAGPRSSAGPRTCTWVYVIP